MNFAADSSVSKIAVNLMVWDICWTILYYPCHVDGYLLNSLILSVSRWRISAELSYTIRVTLTDICWNLLYYPCHVDGYLLNTLILSVSRWRISAEHSYTIRATLTDICWTLTPSVSRYSIYVELSYTICVSWRISVELLHSLYHVTG